MEKRNYLVHQEKMWQCINSVHISSISLELDHVRKLHSVSLIMCCNGAVKTKVGINSCTAPTPHGFHWSGKNAWGMAFSTKHHPFALVVLHSKHVQGVLSSFMGSNAKFIPRMMVNHTGIVKLIPWVPLHSLLPLRTVIW